MSDKQMVPSNPLQRETLADRLLTQLRQQVLSGGLAPGQQLPSEQELCEAFGVGRTTVREALRGLVATGFADRRRNRLVVSDHTLIDEEQVGLAALAARVSVREVFETRKLFEVKSAELAAEHWSGSDLDLLHSVIDRMDQSDPDGFHETDIAFHSAIVRLSKNGILTEAYERSKDLFFRLPSFWRVFGQPVRRASQARTVESAKAAHQRIFTALRERDSSAAGQTMFLHLDFVERDLMGRLNRAEATAESGRLSSGLASPQVPARSGSMPPPALRASRA